MFLSISILPSLCCDYLGAAPTPYVHETILNLPTSFVRNTTVHVLLDTLYLLKYM